MCDEDAFTQRGTGRMMKIQNFTNLKPNGILIKNLNVLQIEDKLHCDEKQF